MIFDKMFDDGWLIGIPLLDSYNRVVFFPGRIVQPTEVLNTVQIMMIIPNIWKNMFQTTNQNMIDHLC